MDLAKMWEVIQRFLEAQREKIPNENNNVRLF